VGSLPVDQPPPRRAPPDYRSQDPGERVAYVNEYNHHLYVYLPLLADEISKAGKERAAQPEVNPVGDEALFDKGKAHWTTKCPNFVTNRHGIERRAESNTRVYTRTSLGVEEIQAKVIGSGPPAPSSIPTVTCGWRRSS